MSEQKAELATRAQDTIEHQGRSMLEIISRAAADPTVDVGKLERLLEIQKTIMTDQRKQAFIAAKARIMAKMPRIEKTARIVVKGVERSRYAKLEDIDTAIRPLLDDEGFDLSFDSKSTDARIFVFTCTLSHRDGHSVTNSLTLPIDASDYRSAVQNVGSSTSYARRQLVKMHFNLIERDEDDDGLGGPQGFITQAQADDVRSKLAEVAGDERKFLRLFTGATRFEEISARDLERAYTFVEDKRRAMKAAPK
jgi:ERF superfamily